MSGFGSTANVRFLCSAEERFFVPACAFGDGARAAAVKAGAAAPPEGLGLEGREHGPMLGRPWRHRLRVFLRPESGRAAGVHGRWQASRLGIHAPSPVPW